MGKNKKVTKEKKDPNVTKFAMNAQQMDNIRVTLTTMGIFQRTLEALNLSLRVEQNTIANSFPVKPAPVGFRNDTRLDIDAGFVIVTLVKIEEPKAPEAPKGAKTPEEKN